ncbi:MAG TPA: hypothetical protein VGG16_26480 [Streptosporangiaceae bacterium]|jgi:hypothetical protein
MSRFTVNTLMRNVLLDDDRLAAYRDDPGGYVARFRTAREAAGLAGLTEPEAAALDGPDYGALYALGAHPYLLWSFTEAVLVPPLSRPGLVESFRAEAERHADPKGHSPDFATTRLEETP